MIKVLVDVANSLVGSTSLQSCGDSAMSRVHHRCKPRPTTPVLSVKEYRCFQDVRGREATKLGRSGKRGGGMVESRTRRHLIEGSLSRRPCVRRNRAGALLLLLLLLLLCSVRTSAAAATVHTTSQQQTAAAAAEWVSGRNSSSRAVVERCCCSAVQLMKCYYSTQQQASRDKADQQHLKQQ